MNLNAVKISKGFYQGGSRIEVLQDLDFLARSGETVAIVGPSGGGKTTLLSLLAGIDRPDRGEIRIGEQNLFAQGEKGATKLRAEHFGIVFQQFHLIQHLSAAENVQLPLDILGRKMPTEHVERALAEVGLSNRLHHRPNQLSGGEIQRVALARALITSPAILLADEPSGNLDIKTGEQVMNLMFDLVRLRQTTLVLVTHNMELAQRCHRRYFMENGQLRAEK